jgi:transposase
MSTRVYLSKYPCQTTPQEETPVCIRIQLSRTTVKDLHQRLQHAYQRDDVRLVRRITVLLDLLVPPVPMAVVCERWGLSPSCLYAWQQAFLLRGMASLVYGHSGGRPPTLPPQQKTRLGELIEAAPLVVGLETACWNSVLIRVLIWRAFGVLYNRHYVCTLLHHLGFSFHKARFVSDHLDTAKRLAWRQDKWPALFRAAKRCNGLILCEEEASLAQWGSRSDTGAKQGPQPEVPTRGKRQGYKVFGAIEYGSGRLCSQGIEGRCNSESYQAFLALSMAQTTAPLFVMHDGATYHTSPATKQLLDAHRARITGEPLPSYAPDDHPIEYLWKKTQQRATHNQSFKEFAALTGSVDNALAFFATHADEVLGLLGRYCEESGLELKQAA